MLIVIVSFLLSGVLTSLVLSRKIGVSRRRAVILVVAGNIDSLISPTGDPPEHHHMEVL